MQYSNSYSFHNGFTNVLNGYNWFLEFYYYSCKTTNYVIFSIQEENQLQVSSNPYTFFQIGVNGDGYYFIQLTLVNNEAISQYREVTTTLIAGSGWNYVAVFLDEIYEYSYVTMYNRHESMTIQNNNQLPSYGYYHRKYETVFQGEYDETRYSYTRGDNDLAIVIGCQLQANFNSGSISNVPYGMCMEGWLQYILGEVAGSRLGYISAYDTDLEIQSEHNCAGNKMCNPHVTGGTTTYSNLVITDTRLFSWDSSSATIASQLIDSRYTCKVAQTTGNTYTPFYQPYIGRITYNKTNYFSCNLAVVTAGSTNSFFGQMFTIESWFRFDPIDMRPNNYISTVFALYDTSTTSYVLGFGVANHFLRIYLGTYIQDVNYLFNATTQYWHYVAVSYIRKHKFETQLLIYIDNIQVMDTTVLWWYNFVSSSTTYWFHIGKDFPGVVRKVKANSRPYCLNKKSLWISTDQSSCNSQGSFDCLFCDIDETGSTTGTYNCFPTCQDFGYYFTGSNGDCKKCHNSCRYCYNNAKATNCYLCNQTALWQWDRDVGYTGVSANNGNTLQCECAAGSFINDQRDTCIACDPQCQTCSSFGINSCGKCKNGGIKISQQGCSKDCPNSLYIKDIEHSICRVQQICLAAHLQAPAHQISGCLHGQYFDNMSKSCKYCASTCGTCEQDNNYCTSCNCGKYLTLSNTCEACDTFWSGKMIVGTNSACLEICGDGANMGLEQCDDGNTNDGDGCSSQCIVEENYLCRGGLLGDKDDCYYQLTELKKATVDSLNHILLEFTRQVTINDTSNSGLILETTTISGETIEVTWSVIDLGLWPTCYVFIETNISDFVNGGGFYDNLFTFKYVGPSQQSSGRLLDDPQYGSIYDENGYEIKNGTHVSGYFNKNIPFNWDDIQFSMFYGKLTLGFISATITLWFWVSLLTGKTSFPCIFIFLGVQAMFYLSLQDLYFDPRSIHYFSYFRIFRIEHPKFPNFFLDYGWIDLTEINTYIFNKDMFSIGEIFFNCFLINNVLKIVLLAGFFALLPFFTVLNFLLNYCTKYTCNWFNVNFGSKFFFGGTFIILIAYIIPVGLTSVLELQVKDYNNRFQVYSFIVAVVSLILIIFVCISLWVIIGKNFNHIQHPLLVEKYPFLYKSIKANTMSIIFIPLYVTEKFLQFGITGALYDKSVGPVIIQSFFPLFLLIYVIAIQPFKYRLNNVIVALFEIPLIAFGPAALPFTQRVNSSQYKSFWIFAITNLAVIVVACLYLLVMAMIYLVKFFFQRRFKNKLKVFKYNFTKPKRRLLGKNKHHYAPNNDQSPVKADLIQDEAEQAIVDQLENEQRQEVVGEGEDHQTQQTQREKFNDTQKPFNVIPEFNDIKPKKILEQDRIKYQNRKKIFNHTDDEDHVDHQMGQFVDQDEKKVRNMSQKPRKKKKVFREKNLNPKPVKLLQANDLNYDINFVHAPGVRESVSAATIKKLEEKKIEDEKKKQQLKEQEEQKEKDQQKTEAASKPGTREGGSRSPDKNKKTSDTNLPVKEQKVEDSPLLKDKQNDEQK